MAKKLMWMVAIVGFLLSILMYVVGVEVDIFTKALTWFAFGVLAICESIEGINKRS